MKISVKIDKLACENFSYDKLAWIWLQHFLIKQLVDGKVVGLCNTSTYQTIREIVLMIETINKKTKLISDFKGFLELYGWYK